MACALNEIVGVSLIGIGLTLFVVGCALMLGGFWR